MRGLLTSVVAVVLALALAAHADDAVAVADADHFIDDYFYAEDLEVVSKAPPPQGLPAGIIELTTAHLAPYKDLILDPKRTRDVLVFLSTSPDARATFQRAVRAVALREDIDMYVFAAPLETLPTDAGDAPTFQAAHLISAIPDTGLHAVAQFPIKPAFGLQLVRDNTRLVDAGLSEAEWQAKLVSVLHEARAPEAEAPAEDSSLQWLVVYGLIAYILLVLLPRIYENRAYLIPIAQSKSTWFFVCAGVMYLSLSGTFFTIIHGSPLFYMSGNGFALMHPASQRQFALEGWTLGGMPLAASIALVGVSEAMPYILGPDNRFQAAMMLLMAFLLLCFVEHVLFTAKNRWYRLF